MLYHNGEKLTKEKFENPGKRVPGSSVLGMEL